MSIFRIIIFWILTVIIGSVMVSYQAQRGGESTLYEFDLSESMFYMTASFFCSIPSVAILIIGHLNLTSLELKRYRYLFAMTIIHVLCSVLTFWFISGHVGGWLNPMPITYTLVGVFLWTISILLKNPWHEEIEMETVELQANKISSISSQESNENDAN